MALFWLSNLVAMTIGVSTFVYTNFGILLPLMALSLVGNAYAQLQRGQPPKTAMSLGATWGAAAVSSAALALELYRIAA